MYSICSNFNPIPIHHCRKNNERIWRLKPPCEKAGHWTKKRVFLESTLGFVHHACHAHPHFPLFPGIIRLFIFFIEFNKFCFSSGDIALPLFLVPSSSIPFSLCSALLYQVVWGTELFYFSFCGEGGLGLELEHVLYKKWIFWLFLADLPTWHETDIYLLCGSI